MPPSVAAAVAGRQWAIPCGRVLVLIVTFVQAVMLLKFTGCRRLLLQVHAQLRMQKNLETFYGMKDVACWTSSAAASSLEFDKDSNDNSWKLLYHINTLESINYQSQSPLKVSQSQSF